jgi:PAS domain S-box-containing protein
LVGRIDRVGEADKYEEMTKEELIERLRAVTRVQAAAGDQSAFEELAVHQEEIAAQNLQLREIQGQLEQSRDRYAELYDFAPLAYATLNAQGSIIEINLTGAALLGMARQYLVGQPLRVFLDQGDREAYYDHLRRCRESGRDVSTQLRFVAKGGRPFPAQLTTHALPSGDVERLQYRCAITDLTELRRSEEERHLALLRENAARTAAETKDRLIAMVSHELRTPLAAVLLWAKILQLKPAGQVEFAHAMEVIVRSAEAQRQLIDDLLDISRITSGKLRLDLRRTEIAPVVRGAVESLLPLARAKEMLIEEDVEERLALRADPERLQQVLWNLISNAVKFTPNGGHVSVSARRFGNELDLRVSDSGEGIDSGLLPHLFEPFRQAETSVTTRAHGGLGLGLAISKQLVEQHGGSIHVRSDGRGNGATFIIRLPLLQEQQPEPSGAAPSLDNDAAIAETLVGLKVLLVEDEIATRSALERVIGDAGAEVVAVDSAQAAIDAFRQRPPDLLVGDIGMPGVDGYQMMRHLRALEQSAEQPPVPALALTAFASKADHERAHEAGFDRHLGKPVQPSELLSALRQLAGSRGTRLAQRPSASG